MVVYETRRFHRWAREEGVTTANLCTAVHEMTAGLYEADLGGGLLKKRIPRSGQGKRGGFRVLIATNKASRWVFLFGFPKNERGNIDKREEDALKALAAHILSLTAITIDKTLAAGELMEIHCETQNHISHS